MNKTLLKSVREYKKQSILAPILVILEVLMEVLIPMEMANIIDIGMTSGDLHYIIQRGVILVVMAMLSLFFGISAGNMAAVAGAGYAKNLRHDIFYKVQEYVGKFPKPSEIPFTTYNTAQGDFAEDFRKI